jgi:hypothetical protein
VLIGNSAAKVVEYRLWQLDSMLVALTEALPPLMRCSLLSTRRISSPGRVLLNVEEGNIGYRFRVSSQVACKALYQFCDCLPDALSLFIKHLRYLLHSSSRGGGSKDSALQKVGLRRPSAARACSARYRSIRYPTAKLTI